MKTFKITPKALIGDAVDVLNYRRNPPCGRWEPGRVQDIEAHLVKDEFAVHYRVALERRSRSVNLIFVTVGDDGIRRSYR